MARATDDTIACIVLSNRRGQKFLSALRDRILQTVLPDWHATRL